MIKNYFKIGIRNLLKHKLASVINLTGLALAIGCAISVYGFIDWGFNQDVFHKKLDNIFVLEMKDQDGKYIGNSPMPMASKLKSEFSEIKNFTRIKNSGATFLKDDNVFKETLSFVDDSFFDVFDFPIKWGNTNVNSNENNIIISEELSSRLFGRENSVGKQVNIRFNENNIDFNENFIVQAVMAKRPYEASFYFEAMVSMRKQSVLNYNNSDDWNRMADVTFLECSTPNPKSLIDNKLTEYKSVFNNANKTQVIDGYFFQPLNTMNLHSYKLDETIFWTTHLFGYIMMICIAIGISLMVCFNYMNIAIASASSRMKEIGMRKTLGSDKLQIVYQFMIENLLLCSLGAIFGLMLARVFFVPSFSASAGFDMTSNIFGNAQLWVFLAVLILLLTLGGATYPSLYISNLKPADIVKGTFNLKKKNRFKNVLLVFQFFMTFLGISLALAFYNEKTESQSKPWGYSPQNHITIPLPKEGMYEQFKTQIVQAYPESKVIGSAQALGSFTNQMVLSIEGKEHKIQSLAITEGFNEELRILLKNGRNFLPNSESDLNNAAIVNQSFLKEMKWTTGIGKTVNFKNKQYEIIGESKDFHFQSFQYNIEPLILIGSQNANVKFAYINIPDHSNNLMKSQIEKIWRKTFPAEIYDYYYQEDVFNGYYQGYNQVIDICTSASTMMVIISIMGIFGLALLVLAKKMKDISIRKVLGAGVASISYQIMKEFLMSVIIASVLAGPLSYYFIESIFSEFSPNAKISLSPFILATTGLFLITAISLTWHLIKANRANPIQSLRGD